MSFLQPLLLIGLPLALLPILIHLINQHRHRTVKWAAMMFLLDAKKLTKGIARLRQILILTMRVLAVLMLLFAASRPLAGGWLALTGGKADTVLVLLDRSASMEQQNLETGQSKRIAALTKISDLIAKTGKGSEVILIDSATLEPTAVSDIDALASLPQTSPTATSGDIPTLLEAALDFLATDTSGRTDIWLASDLRHSDWNPGSGQWQLLRSEIAAKETVRLFLLTFPQVESENLSVSVSQVNRRRTPEGYQLVMDLALQRQASEENARDLTVPVEFTINGTRTVEKMTVSGDEMIQLGHVSSLGDSDKSGWGRIDLPADDNLADNTAFFVFGEAAVRKTVIVSSDQTTAEAIRAAATSGVDPSVTYEALILPPDKTEQIPWEDTALLFWQAPLPKPDSTIATFLQQHAASGRTLIFLPPSELDSTEFLGFQWGEMQEKGTTALTVEGWRTESGLLANTRNGTPLPVGELALFRVRDFDGERQSLLKLEGGETVVAKLITDTTGSVYVWGTLPRSDYSTLASNGVVFFVMVHRALAEGANSVSRAQFRVASSKALSSGQEYKALGIAGEEDSLTEAGLLPAAYRTAIDQENARLVALNRPTSEDDLRVVSPDALQTLLEGVEFRQITDEVGSGSSLASEVWRAFLIAMALALLAEAALCLPPAPEELKPIVSKP